MKVNPAPTVPPSLGRFVKSRRQERKLKQQARGTKMPRINVKEVMGREAKAQARKDEWRTI